MYLITITEAKKHLNIEPYFIEDDGYIETLIDVSYYSIKSRCNNRTWIDYSGETNGSIEIADDAVCGIKIPLVIKHCVLLMVGNLYNNREPVSFGSPKVIPYTIEFLIAPYINYSLSPCEIYTTTTTTTIITGNTTTTTTLTPTTTTTTTSEPITTTTTTTIIIPITTTTTTITPTTTTTTTTTIPTTTTTTTIPTTTTTTTEQIITTTTTTELLMGMNINVQDINGIMTFSATDDVEGLWQVIEYNQETDGHMRTAGSSSSKYELTTLYSRTNKNNEKKYFEILRFYFNPNLGYSGTLKTEDIEPSNFQNGNLFVDKRINIDLTEINKHIPKKISDRADKQKRDQINSKLNPRQYG